MSECSLTFLSEWYENNTTVCLTAGSEYIFFADQAIDGNGQCTDSDPHFPGERRHVDFITQANGIDDMHVIDGDVFESVSDKKIPFNIQCVIKKINKNFI